MSSLSSLSTPPRRTPVTNRFEEKVAIVTGGTHGIGLAIGLELLREGATLVVTGLPADEAEGRASYATAGFPDVSFVFGDLVDSAFCAHLVDHTLAAHGTINLLVNNAFSFISKGVEGTRADWERSFAVGPFAFAALTSLVTEPMRKAGGGA